MRNKTSNYPFHLFKISLIVLVVSMPWSRAFTSIATGLLFIAALAEVFINKPKIRFANSFIWITGIVLLCLFDGLRVSSVNEWFSCFNIKLPLFLLSFSVFPFRNKYSEDNFKQFSLIFCISVTAATLASSINYGINNKEINALVLQSKPIPILGGMHHITFSVFCAFAVIVSAYYALKHKLNWLWILTGINFIGLHVLAARTGLVGLYFACFVLGVVYILNHKPKIQYLIGSLALICILPIIAFYSIRSFHNRIINSVEDVKVIWNQKDANYQSMGMRVMAAKTAFDLIKKHPVIGVGCSNIKQAMSVQYEENNTNLFIENRILPHNQFIMEAAIHGIIGLLLLSLFFFLPLFNNFTQLPILFIALWSLVLFGCMFECLFDRQHGVILVSLFWFIFLGINPSKNKTT